MVEIIDLATWIAGAVIAIGLIQWAKGAAPRAPTWVWTIALPAMSFAAGFAAGGKQRIWNSLGIWAVSQVGWDSILRRLVKGIEGPKP